MNHLTNEELIRALIVRTDLTELEQELLRRLEALLNNHNAHYQQGYGLSA